MSQDTLEEARQLFHELKFDAEGVVCPTCDRFGKAYNRNIHASMAAVLIRMYQESKTDWVYLPDLPQKSRDSAALAYWGLVEEETVRRPDGGRAGYWRVTEKGCAFVENRITVPKWAECYNKKCDRIFGPDWSIIDALGKHFDYHELMNS